MVVDDLLRCIPRLGLPSFKQSCRIPQLRYSATAPPKPADALIEHPLPIEYYTLKPSTADEDYHVSGPIIPGAMDTREVVGRVVDDEVVIIRKEIKSGSIGAAVFWPGLPALARHGDFLTPY